MCGIAGIVDFDAPPSESLVAKMIGLLRHRGPEACGMYRDGVAGLAHARLSIIDLSGGDQPIHNEDHSIWIVYNGEVFNYPELRQRLESRGHRFYTQTDTEILVHLYEDMGTDLFGQLNGQFAFALWDLRKKQLVLGRDRLGIRPLFYYHTGGRLLFASEVKGLFADSRVTRSLDPAALADIFTCWAPLGEMTSFRNIHQLLPGHFALFSQKGLTHRPYWQISFSSPRRQNSSLGECKEELWDLLYDSTRIRLRADVPVGAYLSGGLDSTLITSLVKKFFNNQLCTFSVSFTDDRFDEAPFQEKAVQTLNTAHRRIRCTEADIGESFPQVIWHAEVPLLRTAPAPMFRLSQLVRESDFKVVLTGEGADEIFAGYDIFKETQIRRFWARRPDSKLRPRLLQRLYPDIFSGSDGRARVFLENFFRKGLDRVEYPGYSHLIRWENTSQIKGFFSPEMAAGVNGQDDFENRFLATLHPDFMKWDSLSRAQYVEISIFLANYLLSSQGDRMAMAHAVEGRFPFLDYRVVEFACKLPPSLRLSVLKDKRILRETARGLLPPELAQRPKQPYRAPISRCFLGSPSQDYVDELLSTEVLKRSGYFDAAKVSRLVEKCRRQEGKLLSERENMALVGIISTQLLHHQFIENFPAEPIEEPKEMKIFRA